MPKSSQYSFSGLQEILEAKTTDIPQILLTSPDSEDVLHDNWLSYAISHNDIEIVYLLLQSPFKEKLVGASNTYIEEAVNRNDWAMVDILLNHQLTMNIGTYVKILKNKPELLEKVQACPVDLAGLFDCRYDIYTTPLIMQAFIRRFPQEEKAVKHLFPARNTWLTSLASVGDAASIKVLLEEKAYRSLLNQAGGESERTPLEHAVNYRKWEAVEVLLAYKPQMSIGWYVVILRQKPELLEKVQACPVNLRGLFDYRYDIYTTPLIMQAFIRRFPQEEKAVKYLSPARNTWLTSLASVGDAASIKVLLEEKAYAFLLNQAGGDPKRTPLENAVINRKWEAVKVLLEYKPDISRESLIQIIQTKDPAISPQLKQDLQRKLDEANQAAAKIELDKQIHESKLVTQELDINMPYLMGEKTGKGPLSQLGKLLAGVSLKEGANDSTRKQVTNYILQCPDSQIDEKLKPDLKDNQMASAKDTNSRGFWNSKLPQTALLPKRPLLSDLSDIHDDFLGPPTPP